MSVSSDYLDCFRTEILVDQLYKHNLRMYFWNVSKTSTLGIVYFSTRSFNDVIMYLCYILIINYISLICIMNKTHFTFIYVRVRYSLKI